jgi:phosphoribosylanthranilate isomerase
MRVKICGITNIDDALAAIDAGADYLGFNFYPKSPRYLTPERCVQIQSAIGNHKSAIRTVGIFVNDSPERVACLLDQCGLDLAQLHGEETPEMIAALNGRAFKAFRGIGERHAEYAEARSLPSPRLPLPQGEGNARLPLFLWERVASPRRGGEVEPPAFLVDAYSPTLYGGTGHTADWANARPLAQHYPFFLAGGLTPENVAEAIAQVRPWGVDVASGVESAPGKKDHAKVRAFIANAKKMTDTVME